jgi:Family of unknown function (DUF5681)
MRFQPGQSGNLQGRPKGAKDHRWASVSFWFEELKKDWIKLTPNQRANLSIEMMKMITHKSKSIPADPYDSNFNAVEAMEQLKQIEAKSRVDVKQG